MKRRLLNLVLGLAMVLSLLLGLVAIAMWVRGRTVSDEFTGWHGAAGAGAEGRECQWTARFDNGTVDGGRTETILTFATPQDAEAALAAVRVVEFEHWSSFPPLVRPSGQVSVWNRLGFDANFSTVRQNPGSLPVAGRRIRPLARVERQHWVRAPLWAVALAALAPPSLWLVFGWRRRRRQRLRAGRCPACGYDLRATPGQCPECGRKASVTPPV